MSRIYITASMQHSTFGFAMPTLSIDTQTHHSKNSKNGGSHSSSNHSDAMPGPLPAIQKGERFDFRFNVNGRRSCVGLEIATNKSLPHVEWSSEKGMGKLPMGLGTLASSLLLRKNKKGSKLEGKQRKSASISNGNEEQPSQRSRNTHSSRSHHSPSRDLQPNRARHTSPHGSRAQHSRSHVSPTSDPERRSLNAGRNRNHAQYVRDRDRDDDRRDSRKRHDRSRYR
ncbi:hypothetical protein PVAG01_05626 [Phlyctema vagabunda]|uniref:Uncharacterized protein n=1 Tax=Phlyctema vagabunda TaxID=108571 RepID=A0ABR4PKM6_9HELO